MSSGCSTIDTNTASCVSLVSLCLHTDTQFIYYSLLCNMWFRAQHFVKCWSSCTHTLFVNEMSVINVKVSCLSFREIMWAKLAGVKAAATMPGCLQGHCQRVLARTIFHHTDYTCNQMPKKYEFTPMRVFLSGKNVISAWSLRNVTISSTAQMV